MRVHELRQQFKHALTFLCMCVVNLRERITMVTRLFRGFFARITRLYVGVFYSFSKKYDKEFDKDLCASAVPQKFISLQKQYMFLRAYTIS